MLFVSDRLNFIVNGLSWLFGFMINAWRLIAFVAQRCKHAIMNNDSLSSSSAQFWLFLLSLCHHLRGAEKLTVADIRSRLYFLQHFDEVLKSLYRLAKINQTWLANMVTQTWIPVSWSFICFLLEDTVFWILIYTNWLLWDGGRKKHWDNCFSKWFGQGNKW